MPPPLQVLPIEDLLRTCWNSARFTKNVGGAAAGGHQGPSEDQSKDKTNSFIPEATSKVTLKTITDLMKSDYAWASIALVALLSQESESVGLWCEGCPCPEPQYVVPDKCPGKRRTGTVIPHGASDCPLRSCRAPELACGVAMIRQQNHMELNRLIFNEYVSRAPAEKRAELHSAWSRSTSKIWGILA